MITKDWKKYFIDGFRLSAPYIHAHRGRTFVVVFGGEAVADEKFSGLIHDIALLHSLGIRLILVHGTRPQIESRLKVRGAKLEYANGLRITDDAALDCVKEAAGTVRVEIEALLSMGLTNTPMAGARIGASSGNFVTARPLGIRDGIDYCHTGEVRRIDGIAIQQHLDNGRIVLLSPLGYSPTGEVFNLSAEEVATAAATELRAGKLILMTEGPDLRDGRRRLI
ncbi:MAG: amino-acid N-acetyltransferase, partial [Pseudomonadota bacterium]|nr:amino-acid N-acetyltransferase [Pseudomonadota bacterium]